jgi:hypothetical protein
MLLAGWPVSSARPGRRSAQARCRWRTCNAAIRHRALNFENGASANPDTDSRICPGARDGVVCTGDQYVDVCLLRQSTAMTSGICGPFLTLDASAGFSPKKLPKRELAPIAANLRVKVHESDGSHPPALKEVIFDFDKNFAVEAAGIHACGKNQLKARRVEAARKSATNQSSALVSPRSRSNLRG